MHTNLGRVLKEGNLGRQATYLGTLNHESDDLPVRAGVNVACTVEGGKFRSQRKALRQFQGKFLCKRRRKKNTSFRYGVCNLRKFVWWRQRMENVSGATQLGETNVSKTSFDRYAGAELGNLSKKEELTRKAVRRNKNKRRKRHSS